MEIHENLDLEDLDGEIWKEIEGYNGDYYVSNLGRVKSFKKWRGTDVRILEPFDVHGYSCVGLHKNEERDKTKGIHILMYEGFIGKIPEGCEVHHKDFTKNDFLENFQVMTVGEHRKLHMEGDNHPRGMLNKNHSIETRKLMRENHADVKGENHPMFGSKRPGEKSGNHTLTEQKVINIRIDLKEGLLTQKEIGEMFGVDRTTISKIKSGKTWKHIK